MYGQRVKNEIKNSRWGKQDMNGGFFRDFSLVLCSILISGLEENMNLELIKFVDYVKVALSGEA